MAERPGSVVRDGYRFPRALTEPALEAHPGVPLRFLVKAGLWLLGPDSGLDRELTDRAIAEAVKRS